MTIRKYASVDLKVHKPELIVPRQSLGKFGSFSFKPRPGYVYPRVRAISARINKNFDGFPSIELEKAAHTFQGRPVFVNHNNSDTQRTRGVILASQYHGLVEDDKHITILPEVDALTFPRLARDIIKGDMDSVSMGCDVDNSTCSYCGNVARTAEEFCDHILNNKGQELTKLVNGQPKRTLVFEICRGLNFFEISFVFDPADETAVMQEVVVPDGVKMSFGSTQNYTSGNSHNVILNVPEMSRTASTTHLAYGEMVAPPKVDTLRDDDNCPQCDSDFNGMQCDNCGYITPPEELQDPDTEEAGKARDDQDDDADGDNDDLDYFGDEDDDKSDEEDDDEDEDDDEEPNPYALYSGQPRKEGNVSRTAVEASVGQALAQRRLAEAQHRLQSLGDYDNDASVSSDPTSDATYPLGAEGTDTGENIASAVPAAEAPAFGGGPAEAAPDKSTTVEALDDNEAPGDYGDRQAVMSSTKRQRQTRRAEDMSNSAEARPDDRENVEAPVANQVDDSDGGGTDSQFSESGWDDNAGDNSAFDNEHRDETEAMVPDGTGRTPMQAGAGVKKAQAMVLRKASASQVYQLADLYTELGLVPYESKYEAIAQIEKMPQIVAAHTIKVLGRVKQVLSTQMPQGRVARTAGTIPMLGKTASGRTPSMARQAENRRLASSAEDTLLFIH